MAPGSRPRLALSYWKNVFRLAGVLIGLQAAAPLFESAGAPAVGAKKILFSQYYCGH